ncbi:MAG: hypothetical protein ACR2ML_13445 [Solirubrobacteraceae bacterium]
MIARLKRNSGPAALVVSLFAVLFSTTGVGEAVKKKMPGADTKPRAFGILRLNKKAQFPAKAIPKVKASRRADALGDLSAEELTDNCNAQSVDLGTYCILANPYPVTNEDLGKNDFFFATKTCAELGGYVPSAAQLVGAASRIKLASTIDDAQLTASIDQDPTDGRRDRREMTSTLVTTAAGSSAAGSQGVTDESTGDPKTGEPNPTPLPANPTPNTLQYVTVYDNKDKGGFAGSRPVTQPENFRCAFNKKQGPAADIGEGTPGGEGEGGAGGQGGGAGGGAATRRKR